jgi:hypothetical protein
MFADPARARQTVMEMARTLLAYLALAFIAHAATVRLYLKDGTYHNVREYQKQADRVRYYSTERSDWEEIPLELVDLKRTEAEVVSREQERKEEAAASDAEEKAERAQRREVERIPMESGVFLVEGEKVTVLKQAESKVVNNKRRSILKAISPIPLIAGKATVELEGLKAPITLAAERPELYIRLAAEERFQMIRLTPLKTSRLVQKWEIVPVTKEIIEETDIIETFRQQLGEGLYKIWPTKPLTPGEYAMIEYTEGKGNAQVWDFTVSAPVKK